MKSPVIAIFDIGKTNKKLFLFDEDYKIVFEKTECFEEIKDEDGDACEDLQKLTEFIFHSLDEVFSKKEFDIKAINFSAYGASFVYTDENEKPLTPLYNYLKEYPAELRKKFYDNYGEEKFSLVTASPILGSLNSGMQLYRIKYEKPEIFQQIKYALHLPQFLSYLISKKPFSEITSIGCHTNLWDFQKNKYHEWIKRESIENLLAPIVSSSSTNLISFEEKEVAVGVGLHDSSAALIPYLKYFHESFVLISTGTWCISLNPFNNESLTAEELKQDCLCYLTQEEKPVKASRLFAGYEHEQFTKKLAEFFNKFSDYYATLRFDNSFFEKISLDKENLFVDETDFSSFNNYEEAYYRFLFYLVKKQYISTKLILGRSPIKKIFVDGGFSKNDIYMNLMAIVFSEVEMNATSVAQASAIGAAMAIHDSWNTKTLSKNLIELKNYSENIFPVINK